MEGHLYLEKDKLDENLNYKKTSENNELVSQD